MKKIISVIISLIILTSTVSADKAFRDIQYNWAGNAINSLVSAGVINGYGDGTFKPDRNMTRQEAASLFYNFLIMKNPEIAETDKSFLNMWIADVDNGMWSAEAVKYLVAVGAMDVDGGGAFYPNRNITKGQFAKLLYYYSKDRYPVYFEPYFSDVTQYAEEINTVAGQRILSGNGDKFNPDESVLRSAIADSLCSISELPLVPMEVTLPRSNVISVPYISQLYPVYAVVGCEPTSLLMGMKAKGYAQDVSLRTFLDNMPKTSSNPAKGFVGSPYVADLSKRTRTTIYPPVLSQYASQYGNVSDFSGSLISELQAEILDGNPVVIYATMHWENPFYRNYNIEGTTQTLLSNNHAVLVCGYDMDTNYYYIADPYNENNIYKDYFYWISGSVLEPIYNVRRHAIVVR